MSAVKHVGIMRGSGMTARLTSPCLNELVQTMMKDQADAMISMKLI